MENLKKLRDVLSSTFIYSNVEKFDEDFRELLQIFYFFGFYRPVPSTKRTIYGLMVFLLVPFGYLFGTVDEFFVAFNEGNMKLALINVTVIALMTSFTIQNLTFIKRQKKVAELVKNLQSLHEYEDDATLEVYRRKCCRLVKFYSIYINVSLTTITCLRIFGYGMFKLVIPTLLDGLAEGFLYYPLYIVNIMQVYSAVKLVITTDLLHILCIVRAGVNVEVLSSKLRQCTDNESTVDNERDLTAYVKYHWEIIKETKKIQKLFNKYFMSKAYGTIFIMTCLFYILLKTDIRDDFLVFLLGVVAVGIGLFQFGTLCFFGQWLTSKSEDLLDASYDCKWYNQSKSFKKTLMILRIVCQREIQIGTVRMNFSNALFYQMMSNSYNYYNNMSKTIGSMEGNAN